MIHFGKTWGLIHFEVGAVCDHTARSRVLIKFADLLFRFVVVSSASRIQLASPSADDWIRNADSIGSQRGIIHETHVARSSSCAYSWSVRVTTEWLEILSKAAPCEEDEDWICRNKMHLLWVKHLVKLNQNRTAFRRNYKFCQEFLDLIVEQTHQVRTTNRSIQDFPASFPKSEPTSAGTSNKQSLDLYMRSKKRHLYQVTRIIRSLGRCSTDD